MIEKSKKAMRMTEGGLSPWKGECPAACPPSGTWLTNAIRFYDCAWPVKIGKPKEMQEMSVKELQTQKIFGVYVA